MTWKTSSTIASDDKLEVIDIFSSTILIMKEILSYIFVRLINTFTEENKYH